MTICIYDMDRTITRRPSWTAWLLFYARHEAPWRLLLWPLLLLPVLAYGLKLYDRQQLKEATQRLMMGRRAKRAKVARAAKAFAADFGRRMEMPAALAAMAADKAQGHEIWLATASSRFYAAALAARWPVDRVVATDNLGDEEFISNRIRGENCHGMGKMRLVLASIDQRPEHLVFVSDDASDLPPMLWADEAIAANPTPAMRAIAQARGWAIRDWQEA